MSASPARTTQRMTLRRFVRVTFDNFRELIQTIAAPTTTCPCQTCSRAQTKRSGLDDSQPLPVEPTSMETDTIDGGTLEPDNAAAQACGREELRSARSRAEAQSELSP